MARYADYQKAVRDTLWAWTDRIHPDQLDGGMRQGRPPVLAREFESRNVLVPPDGARAVDIRAAIPQEQRHHWFRSLQSSQALAQSVFGAIQAFDRLDLLQNLSDRCGRPAFYENARGWTLGFEHEVCCLGEGKGRRTSVDVLLSGPERRIAVECKFTEPEFGTCSRPRLQPGDPAWPKQHCDGNYRIQRGRQSRCALTEIGIRYWDYLPSLFDWPSDRDHRPCPFGTVYQLARNALAATVSPNGEINPTGGHVLVLYDARNPAFHGKGEAERQWAAALAACRVPGLLRRASWQSLMSAMAEAPELRWLVDGVHGKYGLA